MASHGHACQVSPCSSESLLCLFRWVLLATRLCLQASRLFCYVATWAGICGLLACILRWLHLRKAPRTALETKCSMLAPSPWGLTETDHTRAAWSRGRGTAADTRALPSLAESKPEQVQPFKLTMAVRFQADKGEGLGGLARLSRCLLRMLQSTTTAHQNGCTMWCSVLGGPYSLAMAGT